MNEDELAKAAVLLAHAPPDVPLPRHLERRILQDSPPARPRTTTTQSAAVASGASAPPRASLVRELAPWCLAAACFAFAVFEWRSAAVLGPPRDHGAASAPTAAQLSTPAGEGGATVAWEPRSRTGSLRLQTHGPSFAPGPFEHRTVWARSVEGAALVLATQVCPGACAQSDSWTLTSSVPLRDPPDMWMTVAPSDGKVDLQKATVLLSTRWPREEN